MIGNNNCGYYGDIEYDTEVRYKIKLKLTEIQKITDLTSIGLQFERIEKNMNEFVLSVAEENLNVYENVSALGIYVTNNYCFFSKLIVQSAFKCLLYEEAMQKLGYRSEGGLWFLKSKPDEDVVIDFIFQFLFYSYAVQSKRANKLSDIKRKCKICSSDLSKSDNRCPICSTVYVENVETIEMDKSLDSCYKKRQANKKMEISAKNITACIYCDSDLDGDEICTVCGCDFGKTDIKKDEKSEEGRNDVDTKNCNTSPINLVMNEEKTNFSLHRKLIPGYSDGNYLTSKEDTAASETGHNIRQTKYPENYTIKSKPLSSYYEDREKGIDKNKVSDELKVDLRDNPESLKNAPLKLNRLGKSFDAESNGMENEMINLISGSHEIDSDKNCGFDSTFDVIDKSKLNVGVHENRKLNSKCSQFGSTTNQSSPIVDAESAVDDGNLTCMSADSDSLLRMGIVEQVRKRSKTLSEVSTHSNDKGEAFGNAKLESDKRSSLRFWSCSYCTYLNDEKSENCVICSEFRNAQKINVKNDKNDENKAECPICRKSFDKRESRWCQTCEQNPWCCPDKDCRKINFVFSKYCIRCGTKKGSDLSNGHNFCRLIYDKEIGLYKCEHCHRCNDWKRDKCVYCKRPRQIKNKCRICLEVHDPLESCPKYNRYIGSVTSV